MNVADGPPEERKCEGVVSDGKNGEKKIISTSSPDPRHVLQVKNMIRVREEVGLWLGGGSSPKCKHDVTALEGAVGVGV